MFPDCRAGYERHNLLHASVHISCLFAVRSAVYQFSSCGVPLTKSPSCGNCTLGQTKERDVILTTVRCGTAHFQRVTRMDV